MPQPPPSEWVIDFGATNHVTNDINNLVNFFSYNGLDSLQINSGAGLPIINIGSSSLSILLFNSPTLYST
jgi:hypothetical protein